MRYAVIENNVVVNIIIANVDYIVEPNNIIIPENDIINIGDNYDYTKKIFVPKNPNVNIIE